MLRDERKGPGTVQGVGGAGGEPDAGRSEQGTTAQAAPTGEMARSIPVSEGGGKQKANTGQRKADAGPRQQNAQGGGERVSQNKPPQPVTTAQELFHETIQHSQDWLREICCDLGSFDFRDGYHAMRAVFAVLREHLPVAETAHLSAQLPVLVRGIFFDGWRPTLHVRARTHDEFIARVRDYLVGQRPVDPQKATEAVFGALCRHVTRGELEDVRACLPSVLKDFLAEPAPA